MIPRIPDASCYVKYVDDATAYSESTKPNDPTIQQTANQLMDWSNITGVEVNEAKMQGNGNLLWLQIQYR